MVQLSPAANAAADRAARYAGGIALATACGYGLYSIPGLLARWGGVTPQGVGILAVWAGLAALAPVAARRRPGAWLIALLAMAAIGARILVILPYLDRAMDGDAAMYPMIAQGLRRGAGLRIYEPYIGSTLYALYPPVYPLLLAGWSAIAGLSTVSLAAMNLVIDAATAAMIATFGARIGRPAAGRAAAWLYVVWPSVLLSSPLAQKEGLIALLVVAVAIAWLDLRRTRDVRTIIAAGVLGGLLALTQPALAPLPGLMALVLFARQPERLMPCALPVMLVTGAVLLPWWVRNWLVLGAFVPLTSAGPVSLWIGNNPAATGKWMPTPVALRGLPELEYGRAIGALARSWIMAHPAGFARLTVAKFVNAAGIGTAEIARLAETRPAPPAAITSALFPMAQAAQLLLLAASAAILLRWRCWRLPDALGALLLAGGAQIVLFNLWFEFGERHRDFMIPLLLLLIAAAAGRQDETAPGRHGSIPGA